MKMRVSSILFAMSIFSGLASAEEMTEVNATLSFDRALLEQAGGAETVLSGLEKQAMATCRFVSLTSVGLSVDEVCAEDILYQAVEKIGDTGLSQAYEGSKLYVETVSPRLELASR
ncbi:MAG: hypothetical protein WA989_11520 [Henriciella sp.]|uniref:hypothetical protein n=1 Tax=Henriciella sp. TaxID=1968823 RepID=UPI003C75FD7E